MANFWKLWGSVIGSIVGIIFAVGATYGFATCTDASMSTTCTILGFSATQVTAALTAIGAALGTVLAPKNSG